MNILSKKKEIARGFKVPVDADSVDSPKVVYGEDGAVILFTTEDEKYGRITFEGFDSLKVCRGEYCPYEDDWKEDTPYRWVSKVDNSLWLFERHVYESRYYKNAYGFGGDVDEMLSDYSHYLFSFHDQFVEVIASGVWFEKSETPFIEGELTEGHPFLPIIPARVETISAGDLVCQVRLTSMNESQLLENINYCSQPVMELALELDGSASVDMLLRLRIRNGKVCSILDRRFCGEAAVFDGIANIEDIKPYVKSWLCGISERRREMDK